MIILASGRVYFETINWQKILEPRSVFVSFPNIKFQTGAYHSKLWSNVYAFVSLVSINWVGNELKLRFPITITLFWRISPQKDIAVKISPVSGSVILQLHLETMTSPFIWESCFGLRVLECCFGFFPLWANCQHVTSCQWSQVNQAYLQNILKTLSKNQQCFS